MSLSPNNSFSPRGVWGVAVISLLALSLLWLGVPRVTAAFLMLPGDGPLWKLHRGVSQPARKLEKIIETRTSADLWVTSGRVLTDKALAVLLQARAGPLEGATNAALYKRAIEDLERGLAAAPADPHGWVRLALAKQLLSGPSTGVASNLVMSLLTGPYEPELIGLRLELGFRNWAHLNLRDQELLEQQIRYGWKHAKNTVLRIAGVAVFEPIIRKALARDPNSLADFLKRFSKPTR